MVWIININHGIKEPPTRGYQYCSTSQILIFGGYVKVRKYFYTQVIIWVNTILTILILGWFYRSMRILAWYIDPNGIKNTKYREIPIPYWYQIIWNPHDRYPKDITKRQYQTNTGTNVHSLCGSYLSIHTIFWDCPLPFNSCLSLVLRKTGKCFENLANAQLLQRLEALQFYLIGKFQRSWLP